MTKWGCVCSLWSGRGGFERKARAGAISLPALLLLGLAALGAFSGNVHGATISVEVVTICVQLTCDLDPVNALVTGPVGVGAGSNPATYSTMYSAQFCIAGEPGCPLTGGSPFTAPRLRTRFTNVDIACEGSAQCDGFGVAFGMSGTLNGNFTFRFKLDDIVWDLPPGTHIQGNMYMELVVDDVYLPVSVLSFDSRNGDSFGPTAPLRVSGRDVPFKAFGGFLVLGMPAGSRMQILHSGDFDFEVERQEAIPEPGTSALALSGLLAAALAGRARRRWRSTR